MQPHIDHWIFDLDNTLYPASCNLFDQIAAKMTEMMRARLGISSTAASKLRHKYYTTYGTTLRGLMIEHGWEPHGFLDYVHDIDYSVVPARPDLAAEIASLPGRKLIFTAGTRKHAANVLAQLGCDGLFEAVFDISDCAFIPKPSAEPYDIFIQQHGVDPARSVFFEDIADNLIVPRALGMQTVLVSESDAAVLPAHVDYVTANLVEFLQGRQT